MNRAWLLGVLVCCALVASCARATPEVPAPPGQDLIVLAPDPEDKEPGHLIVSAGGAQVELTEAYASTTIASGGSPAAPAVLDEADVQRMFGDVLSIVPPAAQHFNLYFETGSDVLTPASMALVDEVTAAVKDRVAPEVSVIGHTDTTGSAETNFGLGLKRAQLIRSRLIAAGLDAWLIDVASHGEADLLVPTADNVAEARNRRVEVTVR